MNNAKAIQTSFNTLFNIENIANFYIIGFSFFLTCYYFEMYKNLTIKNCISQPLDHLALV